MSSSASVLTHWKFWLFLPMTNLTDQKAQLWPNALPALSSPGAETEVLGRSAGPCHTCHLGGKMTAPSRRPLTALTSLGPAPRASDPRPTRPPRCIQDSTVSLHPLASWPDSRFFPWATRTGLSPHRPLVNNPGPRGQGSACETGKCDHLSSKQEEMETWGWGAVVWKGCQTLLRKQAG